MKNRIHWPKKVGKVLIFENGLAICYTEEDGKVIEGLAGGWEYLYPKIFKQCTAQTVFDDRRVRP